MSRPLCVFKLTYDELAALLPQSAFGSLDTSLDAVCRVMCQDGLFGESDIRRGLEEALQVLTKPPELVLKDMRKWALEFLRDETSNKEIFFGPLGCPPPSRNSDAFETRTRVVTAKQARGVLANAFFANCLDTMETQKDERNSGGLDWRRLLRDRYGSEGVERMRCHLLYFEASLTETDLDRRIIFERIRYAPLNFAGNSAIIKSTGLPPVGRWVVLHNNVMEKPTRKCSALVNFANANFGYGKFSPSCTQEEILLSCCPEISVGLLLIGKMEDNEVVNVSNVRRYVNYSGYLGSFQCQGTIHDVVIQDILTIDACFDKHFSDLNIERDLNKAYASFRAHAEAAQRRGIDCCISTGKWGCGAFGGLPVHKFVQQILAAHVARVGLDFSAFGAPESCDVILNVLDECEPTAHEVGKALHMCASKRSFVEDFRAALISQRKTRSIKSA